MFTLDHLSGLLVQERLSKVEQDKMELYSSLASVRGFDRLVALGGRPYLCSMVEEPFASAGEG